MNDITTWGGHVCQESYSGRMGQGMLYPIVTRLKCLCSTRNQERNSSANRRTNQACRPVMRMTQSVCTALNCTVRLPKAGHHVENGYIYVGH